jgi:ATP-dependent DNA helicase RecQ
MDSCESQGPDSSEEDEVAALALRRFGIPYLQPLQRFVVANVLDANEGEAMRQIAILPTGFGKSLCFQLPALLLPGPTLVIYPLLALMADQARRLADAGVGCAVFRGGMEDAEREKAERAVEDGSAGIILTNPESLRGRLLEFLVSQKPSHVAIDEAHCVSEWGESFRPAYLELGAALEELAAPATSAFTATASPVVLDAVRRILFRGADCRLVQGDADRPNIRYAVRKSLCPQRDLEILVRDSPRPAIVFASSREGVQIIAEDLRRRLGSREIRFYHAGLTRDEKRAVEGWFFESGEGVLVSTCAYGIPSAA